MSFVLPIELGKNLYTNKTLILPENSFNTHYHLIGATGTGKTTALETLIQELLTNSVEHRAFFIIDPLGGFAHRLLRFIADDQYCPASVRDRLIYFEPAQTDYITTLQPLEYHSRPNQDFQVARAMDLLLRGFEAQELANMPRLRRFLYQAVFDISQLQLPLAMTRYLLHPGINEHNALVDRLPPDSQAVWRDVMRQQGNKALDYLDSTRNRVAILSDNIILQRMFSSTQHRLDVGTWMDEGRIVILNLNPGKNAVSWTVADTIGAVLINEVMNRALELYHDKKAPTDTFLIIDEFQRFLGPDIYNFLPIIRNLGLKMVLANQSYSQLEQGEVDLRPMMAQARTRLMFANDFEDADIIAEEIANLKWNPDEVKHEVQSHRQRLVGHRTIVMRGGGDTHSKTATTSQQAKRGTSDSSSRSPDAVEPTRSTGKQISYTDVIGGSTADAVSENWHEQLVPIHEDFYETTGVQFRNRDDVVHEWRKRLRELTEGKCYVKLVQDPELKYVDVNYLPPIENDPRLDDAVAELLERNYSAGPFISATQADRDFEAERGKLLSGPTTYLSSDTGSPNPQGDEQSDLFDH